MKKLFCLLLCLAVVFTFAACGSKEPVKTETQNGGNNKVEATHSFTYDGTKVEMGVEANDVLEKLGEPKSVTEEASCAFDGLDKTYSYGSFYVTTYPNGQKENFYSAWFVDDSVATDEGIYIGSSKTDVENAYGKDAFDGINSFSVTKGKSKLTIIIEDDFVTDITYDAIID